MLQGRDIYRSQRKARESCKTACKQLERMIKPLQQHMRISVRKFVTRDPCGDGYGWLFQIAADATSKHHEIERRRSVLKMQRSVAAMPRAKANAKRVATHVAIHVGSHGSRHAKAKAPDSQGPAQELLTKYKHRISGATVTIKRVKESELPALREQAARFRSKQASKRGK